MNCGKIVLRQFDNEVRICHIPLDVISDYTFVSRDIKSTINMTEQVQGVSCLRSSSQGQ